MPKPLITMIAWFAGSIISFAQPLVYTHPEQLPNDYRFDGFREYNLLMSERMPEGVKQKDYSRYAEYVSFRKQDWFNSGDTYIAWEPAESYLNQIVQRLSGDSRDGKKLRIYVLRQSTVNAYALHDGTLFITLGLLADVYNEAALAAILAHEIAHFRHQDVRESFIKHLKLYHPRTRTNEGEILSLDMAHEDRQQELKADSVGFIMAFQSGYDISHALRNFYLWMGKEEALWLGWKLKDGGWKRTGRLRQSIGDSVDVADPLATHPEFSVRIAQLERMRTSRSSGAAQVISDSMFHTIQELARIELLQVLLEESNLKTCASRALTYYLEDPTDPVPVYYLLESIRRLLYIKPELAHKGFLTETESRVADSVGVLDVLDWLEMDPEKRERFNLNLVFADSIPMFQTYSEAFAHFSQVAVQMDCRLCYLPLALRAISENDTSGFSMLERARVAFPAYTKFLDEVAALKGGNDVAKQLSNLSPNGMKNLVMVSSFQLIEYKYYGIHEKSLLAANKRNNFIEGIRKMAARKFPTYQLVDYQTMAPENMRHANELKRALSSTLLLYILEKEELEGESHTPRTRTIYFDQEAKEEEGDKMKENNKGPELQKNLFLFDPALYATFQENDLSSIAFLSIWGIDDKTQWIKILNIINPFYYYFFFSNVATAAMSGSDRYGYGVDMVQVRPGSKNRVGIYSETVSYKLNHSHLQNTVYYAIENCK